MAHSNSIRKNLVFAVLFGLLGILLIACGAPATEEPAAEAPAEEAPAEAEAAAVEESGEEAPTDLAGELNLAGSTTVQPLAEVLAGEFMAANPDLVINVGAGGSSAGVTAAGEGAADIGMASRNIKDSEFETFPDLQVFPIAYDGIAIVTNPGVELENLSIEEVAQIFAGEVTNFSEVGGPDAEIVVVSREEGSGTRGAFEELVMEAGDEELLITDMAILQPSNGAVRTTVAETEYSIAYISFGFLDDSVSAVPIDGAEATVDNVLGGSYPIFRPLNMVTLGDPSETAQAFLDYILDADGQAVVSEDYIPVATEEAAEEAPAEAAEVPTDLAGELNLAGSTTVQPLAEVLAGELMGSNADLVINVGAGGSSAGVTAAGEGAADIGMASRNIKDSEFETFPDLQVFPIAYDGIAIVTNPGVELETLSIEQVAQIFAGEITNFSEVGGPDGEIVVVSREEGSGTRGAFEELVMEAGDEELLITDMAILQPSNGAVRTTVAETENSIAFISFGFLDDSVNAVPIDGAEATVENVLGGSYPIFRPLNMVTLGEPTELAQAFLDFILGPVGQEIVSEDYIPVD